VGAGAHAPAVIDVDTKSTPIHPTGRTADEQSKTDRIAQIYRHSDGYPDSVLRDLVQLKELLDETRTERGPAYAAAQFLFLDTLSTMTLYVDEGRDRSIHADHPSDLLSSRTIWSTSTSRCSCSDTASRTQPTAFTATRRVSLRRRAADPEPVRRAVRWTVKVSGHSAFPRWDGPTEEAFERASWQFHGPLEQALEEIVAEPG